MSYEFFVNMQKRGDGRVYADLHKTDERIYFNAEEAQKAVDSDPVLARYRHTVPLIAVTRDEYARLDCGRDRLWRALDNLVRAVNVKEPDPLIVFATIEQAKHALEQGL